MKFTLTTTSGSDFEDKYSHFAGPYLKSYNKVIDCADLALTCIVECAYANDLPPRLFYYNQHKKFPMDSATFNKSSYLSLVKSSLNAHGVIDNTLEIKLRTARPGCLLMTERPTLRPWEEVVPNDPERQRERMGHTRIIVSVTYNAAKPNESRISFLNSSFPAIVPQERTEPYETFTKIGDGLDPAGVHSIRRWNYAFFNTPQPDELVVAASDGPAGQPFSIARRGTRIDAPRRATLSKRPRMNLKSEAGSELLEPATVARIGTRQAGKP